MSKGYYNLIEIFDEKQVLNEIKNTIQSKINSENTEIDSHELLEWVIKNLETGSNGVSTHNNVYHICFRSMNPPIEFTLRQSEKYPDTLFHLRSIHAAVSEHVEERYFLRGKIIKEYHASMNE